MSESERLLSASVAMAQEEIDRLRNEVVDLTGAAATERAEILKMLADPATIEAVHESIYALRGPLDAGLPEDRHGGERGHRFLAGCPICVGDVPAMTLTALAAVADLIAKRDESLDSDDANLAEFRRATAEKYGWPE